jgi:hypothetical protein
MVVGAGGRNPIIEGISSFFFYKIIRMVHNDVDFEACHIKHTPTFIHGINLDTIWLF